VALLDGTLEAPVDAQLFIGAERSWFRIPRAPGAGTDQAPGG
jgi:hypothetical protein